MRLIPYLVGIALVVGSWAVYTCVTTVAAFDNWHKPPVYALPSVDAKKLIASMLVTKGWRMGKYNNCIVNEKADIIIYSGNPKRNGVFKWDGESVFVTFSASDLYWVDQNYHEARRLIELASLNKASE